LAGGCLGIGLLCAAFVSLALATVFVLAAGGTAMVGAGAGERRPSPTGRAGLSAEILQRATVGDPDLYLDLDLVEVHAVYRLDAELYAHLRGGIGQRVDPFTGDRRSIETSDVSLTWRCGGRRAAERLATQLNEWEAKGTPLRLLAMKGSCAVLIEDASNWVTLPELRLAA
jgi:hypothetical protein